MSQTPKGMLAHVYSWIGTGSRRKLAQWGLLLPKIEAHEAANRPLGMAELRKQSLSLRYRAKSGESLSSLLPEAFALVRESSKRLIGMRHFDVQILGGIGLFHGSIAEMETGEGKTLTASLPLYLHALTGKGAHLATVNDYLASRDADILRRVYESLGLTVGVVQTKDDSPTRREAYSADITYGTAKEFGFDFLRDRLLQRRLGVEQSGFLGEGAAARRGDQSGEKPVQRGLHFCLVDEADSILIDEARTPLIIGSLGEKARETIVATYRWAAEIAPRFLEDEHFHFEEDEKRVDLTPKGRQFMRSLPRPANVESMGLVDLYEYTERAIKVKREFHLNRHYVVVEGEIVIVDENTGRLAEGRKWRDGIHQAIEAKEKIEVTMPTGQAARVTIQDLFLRYQHLAGMTGTAVTAAHEFRRIYKRPVIAIPTNRPSRRTKLPDRVFGSSDAKWHAIVEEVHELHEKGRPILIGTRSIDKSVLLSELLKQRNLPHQVLNAHNIALEAEIVAQAGQSGNITVATNMAGRGTDIKLTEATREAGGLHVICTELHDSARIDRQLMGRCGRQGDPGTTRHYMSLDDDVLKNAFGPEVADRYTRVGEARAEGLESYGNILKQAQRKVERKHFRDRMILLHHEKERKKLLREMGHDPYLDTPD